MWYFFIVNMVKGLILLVTLFLLKQLKLLLHSMQLFRSCVCLIYISLFDHNLILPFCTLVCFICDISLPLSPKANICVETARLRPSVRPSETLIGYQLCVICICISFLIQHYSSFVHVLHSFYRTLHIAHILPQNGYVDNQNVISVVRWRRSRPDIGLILFRFAWFSLLCL
jgi:hypothetical protein